MAVRVANWLAIAVGGAGGTLAAIAGSAAPPPLKAGIPLRPVSEISAQVQAATPASANTALSKSDAPLASSAPLTSTAALGSEGGPSASAAEPSPAAPITAAAPSSAPEPATSADTAPLPTTHEKLLRTEMHCDQGKSESCIVAARSYEVGSAGVTDPAKAAKYRRIALTMWISHCDHNSAAACVTLSKLYRAGEGVPQSDRNADALIGRARDLCRFTVVPVCSELRSL